MNNIPQALGPYSAYRRAGDLVITSGQIPLNPATNEVEATTLVDQAKQCLTNIEAILKQENGSLADVVKFTVFMTDLSHFSEINEVMADRLHEPYPARSAIEISKLPKNVQVEIEAIAYIKA